MLGGLYLDPATAREMSASAMVVPKVDPAPTDLTNRESEVLRMVALGFSSKEVAHKVSMSIKSVETYKARATEKLKLYSRAQIVNFAMNSGWLNYKRTMQKRLDRKPIRASFYQFAKPDQGARHSGVVRENSRGDLGVSFQEVVHSDRSSRACRPNPARAQ